MKIEGLTEPQSKMLDTIWSFQTHEQYLDWQGTLGYDEYLMSITLMYLLKVEVIDDATTDPSNLKLYSANQIINRIRYCNR